MIDNRKAENGFDYDDKRIWERLIAENNERVCGYITKIVRNEKEAEDIRSEALTKLWGARQTIESEVHLKHAWYVTARNLAINYLKKEQGMANKLNEIARTLEKVEQQSFEIYTNVWLIHEAFGEIDKLPDKCKQVMTMFFKEGKSVAAISQEMNITADTVRNHKGYGLRKIREAFEGYPDVLDLGRFMVLLILYLIIKG